jgi:SAM-dependent methyltransferase
MPDTDPGSVAFDRAAEFYDASRGTDEEDTRREAELVAGLLEGHGPVLEIGVGTGAMARRLHAAGVPMIGFDLSMPMLRRLVRNAGGSRPFPLVQADATRMPFADDSFEGGLARWVFHLIPRWEAALGEVARVMRPGGVLVVNIGGAVEGPWEEMRERLGAEIGRPLQPVGLPWRRHDLVDEAVERLGGTPRDVPPLRVHEEEPLAAYLDGVEGNLFSWTWPLSDEERSRAVAAVRPWAEERFGPLDRPYPHDHDVVWRAYDLP